LLEKFFPRDAVPHLMKRPGGQGNASSLLAQIVIIHIGGKT